MQTLLVAKGTVFARDDRPRDKPRDRFIVKVEFVHSQVREYVAGPHTETS